MEYAIEHNAEKEEFFIDIEGATAVIEYRLKNGTMMDIYRTFVPESLRGKGLAGQLMKRAISFAREHRLKVKPTCSYAVTYMDRHPEFAFMRAEKV